MTRLTRFFVLSYVSAAWITLPAILTLTIPVVQAQEEAATEEASTEEASTDEASTDEASTDEASTEESSAEDAAPEITETNVPPFADVFEQWKTLLGKLREVRQEFDDAEDDALSEIAERHRALVVEAQGLVPILRAAAVAQYAAAPNRDRTVTRLLFSMVQDDVARDDYEPAAELTKLMMENQCDEKGIYDLAGVVAFCTNDFEHAEQYLRVAQGKGELSSLGSGFVEIVAEYKKLWEEESRTRESEAAADDLPRVTLQTSRGEITIELFENEAPQTVGNFISLVEQGFYDNLTFHRVLKNFMAQGGCPDGTGEGGPGYKIFCECHKPETRKHFRGSLSMAHAGQDTGGSQFFLTFVPTAHLNGRHTVFGRVIEGFEVLAKFYRIDPQSFSAQPPPDRILSATVTRKRDHAYTPSKVE